jgi:predicted DNA-binding protein
LHLPASQCYHGDTMSAGCHMSTTSLKLPEELKQKATAAARQMGLSLHAFMLEAIEQATHGAEMRAQFMADAKAARSEMLQSEQGLSPDAVKAYLRKRLSDPNTPRPESESWPDSATPGKR